MSPWQLWQKWFPRASEPTSPQPVPKTATEARSIFVTKQEQIEELWRVLRQEKDVPLDTEADNLHHYETRVCLMQIEAGGIVFLLDPLGPVDLSPLWSHLRGKRLLMHGSDFDLRLLHQLADFQADEVFDTMLAAQLLGMERIGLASLLQHYFQVDVPKDSQKSDWSKRPLSEKMTRYAIGDVYWMRALVERMESELAAKGRLDWHRQKCHWQIENAAAGFAHQDPQAWRIGAWRRLSARGQGVLHDLWHWREETAKRRDRPPFKIIGTEYLFKLAEASQSSPDTCLDVLTPGLRRRYESILLPVIRRALTKPASELPPPLPRQKAPPALTAEELSRQERLKEYRNRRAEELGLDPTLLATRGQLAQLARQPGEIANLLLPWQSSLLKDALASPLTQSSGGSRSVRKK